MTGKAPITKTKTPIFRIAKTYAEAMKYLSMPARRYAIEPIIERLVQNLDNWAVENACTQELMKFAGYIPSDLLPKYVNAITQTYVGYVGSSYQSSRKDF